ncbi:glycosyltransferase, partial [Psychrobacter sp. Rd 27.2]|uniref:glycosyltransferase n=1 Tax=Psychrobacter sp. Rd 27.2 TaxID=1926479 RepID=UPI000961FD4A
VPEGVATIHFGFSHFLPKVGEQVVIHRLCLETMSRNEIVHNESNTTFNEKYQTIQEFLEKKSKSEAFSSDNLLEVFGVKVDNRTFLLKDTRYFFESLNDKPTYKFSSKLCSINSSLTPEIGLRFSFDISTSLEVVVIISFFEGNSKKRVSYNMLPINRNLKVSVPDNADFFNLGLKITGDGAIDFRDIKIELLKPEAKKIDVEQLDEGISIILPSYKGRNTIIDTLTSITNQRNIDFSLIEVVIVVNGEEDGTIEKVQAFSRKNPFLKIDCSYSEVASASHARNLAVLKATKDYLVFCDDDDLLSEEYLAALYKVKGPNSIGFCRIYDLTEDNELQKVNVINNQLLQSLSHKSSDIKHFSSAITMIASKIIPTAKIKNLMFDERLKSGEDVSYFTDYFITYSPKLIMSDNEKAYYIRRVRGNSLSRQEMSFDFNVSQRLDVIKSLSSLKTKASNQEGSHFIESKIRAQCGFIVSYLKENPDDYKNVHLEVIKRKIDNFPYMFLQGRLGLVDPKLLVISYCHPPFVDTSAVVTAKRVFEFDELCDVVCADMSSVRDINPDLYKIDQHLIRDSYMISTMTSFSSWNSVYDFSTSAMRAVEGKSYDTVYSRSFWPASHFAAFEYKRRNPNVRWIAEFSDPVIFNIEGGIRDSKISQSWVEEVVSQFNLKSALLKEFNLYVWCELIVYLFADEIIFTCENQKNLMLDRFPYSEYIVDKDKSANIAVHPTLPSEFYESYDTNYRLDSSKVNLAYFGAFYKTRRLDDLIEAIRFYDKNNLKSKNFKQPMIHIFTEQTDSAYEMIEEEGLKDYFVINPYVNYFEFLSISKKMDVLIVNDAKARDVFGFNPYLPSKISDYIGSDSAIWSFYEEGSELSKLEVGQYFTKIDSGQAHVTLSNIINDF